jgi:hypothetical protein
MFQSLKNIRILRIIGLVNMDYGYYIIMSDVQKVKTTSTSELLADMAWDIFSVLPIVWTCLQVIFTCSHN